MAKHQVMDEDEALALTHAYVTLRNELHHLALQALPAIVDNHCFIAERECVLKSKLKWLGEQEEWFVGMKSYVYLFLPNKLWYYFGLF